MTTAWVCASCGVTHSSLPLCFGAEAPWRGLVPDDELAERVELDGDRCVVDSNTFFLRGHIELPIQTVLAVSGTIGRSTKLSAT